jgi:hypothetical protein
MSDMTFWGLGHLVGQTVAVFLGGLDVGDYTVASDGSVGVNFAADSQGLCTATYLTTMSGSSITAFGDATTQLDLTDSVAMTTTSYFVPCVIGNVWSTEIQLLRQNAEAQAKTPQGPGLAKTRRAHQYGLLLENTTGTIYVGTDLASAMPVPMEQAGVTYNNATLFSGVAWNTLDDQHSFDGQLALRVTRPTPMTLCSTATFMETEER